MNLAFTGQLANRLAAFERFRRNPKLEGCRVSPPSLDHFAASPQAWLLPTIYTMNLGSGYLAGFVLY